MLMYLGYGKRLNFNFNVGNYGGTRRTSTRERGLIHAPCDIRWINGRREKFLAPGKKILMVP